MLWFHSNPIADSLCYTLLSPFTLKLHTFSLYTAHLSTVDLYISRAMLRLVSFVCLLCTSKVAGRTDDTMGLKSTEQQSKQALVVKELQMLL